ncbi:MAG: hypothetical protein PHG61_07265 [Candidatus Marinimicrobia bacterium]|nr:hypothetical protein [Candidatus Neomarinimicrobiota bacterium]
MWQIKMKSATDIAKIISCKKTFKTKEEAEKYAAEWYEGILTGWWIEEDNGNVFPE